MVALTVTELAKRLAVYIHSGRGDYAVNVHQWGHGFQPLTVLDVREGNGIVELYSGTTQTEIAQPEIAQSDLDDLI